MKSPEQSPYRSPTLTPPIANADRMSSPTSNTDFSYDRKRTFEDDDVEKASSHKKRRREELSPDVEEDLGRSQAVLLLHAAKQRYMYTKDYEIPSLKEGKEMLVKVQAIGLNPIDWKAPDYGFALPDLPCISGRDFAGVVVRKPKLKSRIKIGDKVLGISTDYRDSRKSAYQEYSIASDFNACRLPSHLSTTAAAPLGVAFVAAALSLGICLGVDFSAGAKVKGPNMRQILESIDPRKWPEDVRDECANGILKEDRPVAGDWIAIWGGSSATGCVAAQLAKLAGLRVICILDVEKNGERLLKHGADLLVDRHDTARAISIIRGVTKGKLRYGLDTRGRDSATLLADAMELSTENVVGKQAHLAGLTGLPKQPVKGVVYHNVPIKAFHEAPELGEGMMVWLEKLLELRILLTPDMVTDDGGLAGINEALDRLRDGSVNGPRIVVPL